MHGLNERLPVVAFYQGLDHIYRLAVDLGEARRAARETLKNDGRPEQPADHSDAHLDIIYP